jgi:hypothetical protein
MIYVYTCYMTGLFLGPPHLGAIQCLCTNLHWTVILSSGLHDLQLGNFESLVKQWEM